MRALLAPLSRRVTKQMRQVSCPLMRPEKRNRYLFPVAAALASQPIAHLSQRKIITQVSSKLQQTQPGMMAAFATVRSVIVRLIDVSEAGVFELGIFHATTLQPPACGSLLYNSYSGGMLSPTG